MPLWGEVEGDQGGCEAGGSEGAGDETEGDAGCVPRGGVSMAEGMDGAAGVGETGALCGVPAGALDAGSAQGLRGGRTLLVIASGRRQAPGGVPVRLPGASSQRQGLFGQGDGAVCGALASVDMDEHPLSVDSGNLQGERCVAPETQGGDGGAGDLIGRGGGGVEESPDCFNTAHRWESACGVGADEREGMPVALQDRLGAEREATGTETPGSRGEVIDVLAGQEGVLRLGCGAAVRGCAKALRT
jgi:hypothetical protein